MRKKTKIVATISDKKCDVDFIRALRKAGMNVVRLNTAHQSHEDTLKVINNVRAVSERIALLLDTKGPEIRTTKAPEVINVKFGDEIFIKGDPNGITTRECICVNYTDFVDDVPVGNKVLIDDGSIQLKIKEKIGDKLLCVVDNDGLIEGRKSVNIPSVHVKLPALSQKDIDFIHFACDQDLDFIAHSFVRNKEDAIAVQKILDERGSKIKIIAKIENQAGVDNIDEILDHVYGIMVARGDLAVEVPQYRIPVIQKMLIEKCVSRNKPVITATQMLHSMIHNPRPTRAEISDVANAIYDGTDAVMLSGETAYGDYPIESVQMMTNIAMEVETAKVQNVSRPMVISEIKNEIVSFIAYSAVKAHQELKTKAILADTTTGRTIKAIAAYRGNCIIFAQCYNKKVMRELSLSYGVYVNFMEGSKSREGFIYDGLQRLMTKSRLAPEDRVVVVAGNFGDNIGASFMEISTVKNLLETVTKSLNIQQ